MKHGGRIGAKDAGRIEKREIFFHPAAVPGVPENASFLGRSWRSCRPGAPVSGPADPCLFFYLSMHKFTRFLPRLALMGPCPAFVFFVSLCSTNGFAVRALCVELRTQ